MADREELIPHVRQGEQPPEGSRLVLRGGPDTPSLLRTHAMRVNRLYTLQGEEVYGISVFAVLDDVGPTSYASLLRDRLRSYPFVHTPRVQDLLVAGFTLLPTFRRPHYTVLMSSLSQTGSLHAALGELRPNPYAVS